MLFEQALQIIDENLAILTGTRKQHFELQQAVAALQNEYKKALDEVERLQAEKDAPPTHRD